VNIDERLRAASRALRDGSVAQVDAASRLREIVRHSDQLVAHGPTTLLPDPPGQPREPPMLLAPSPPSAARWSRSSQRLALAVNLLLVLALGIVIGVAATDRRDVAGTAPTTAAPVVAPPAPAPAETGFQTRTSVPEACLEMAELGDEVIARLNRNQRDNRLFLALRDYTIASQACRKEASP
jgi:hypothetical protein